MSGNFHKEAINVTFLDEEIDPYGDITISTGRKKSGKSTLSDKISHMFDRVIIWDYNYEHYGKTYQRFLSWFIKPNEPIVCRDLKDLKMAYSERRHTTFRIIYQPKTKTKEHFNEFCKFINEKVVYCCIYVEELQNMTSATSIPDQFEILEASGRHQKCGLLLTCRSNKRIPTRIFDDADYIFMFKQRRPESYEYMKEYIDDAKVEALKEAPDYWFIMVDKNSESTLCEPINPEE